MKKLTILALGAKALNALRAIPAESRNVLAEVVVACDPNVLDDCANAIREFCAECGISYSERTEHKRMSGDIIVAIGWRWMVNVGSGQSLLVFHDSLLPKYRGFNPLVTALINGDKLIGVTVLFGAAEYDEGDIIAQRSICIEYPIKIKSAIAAISVCYSELLAWVVQGCMEDRLFEGTPQLESESTYSLWRDHEDYFIDWNQPASRIRRMIDAVGDPYQGARSTWDGTVVTIGEAEEIANREIANRTPGKVLLMRKGCPVVVCNPGLLMLTRVRTERGEPCNFGSRLRIRFK